MFATHSDSMCLYVGPYFFFIKLFQKPRTEVRDLQAQKQNLTWNSHSRTFKVTCLEISGKPMRDSISQYDLVYHNIGSESIKNCRCRQPHCHLTPPVQWIHVNIHTNHILVETKVPQLHVADSISLVHHSA